MKSLNQLLLDFNYEQNFKDDDLKIIKELLEKENTKESEFLWTRTGNYNFAYIGL